ncbi:putative movement protein [Yerba mate chlorosis-associated virus]|uniref:Movement protein n=1 Tax=Yerba mate chlorosis-associated virus TaxID=2487100 RepID=A0A3G3SFF9_9RHAB|nr:putative movement protein [Yerba mate chlorosis-associated virus]AYR67254.1 putative movement protein [Yerba mate chlorosis-associated virus]
MSISKTSSSDIKDFEKHSIELAHHQHQEEFKLKEPFSFKSFLKNYCTLNRVDIYYEPYFSNLSGGHFYVNLIDLRYNKGSPFREKITIKIPLDKPTGLYLEDFPTVPRGQKCPWRVVITTHCGDIKFGSKLGKLAVIPSFLYTNTVHLPEKISIKAHDPNGHPITDNTTIIKTEQENVKSGNNRASI